MNRLLLLQGTWALAALVATGGCNRTETKQEARQVTDTARVAAARAGEKIADSWVTTKIQAKYFADRTVKARYINVDTRDGVVTLSGYVENPELRTKAEQIARSTDGVRTVVDQLMVGHAPPGYVAPGATGAVATTGSGDNPVDSSTRSDDASITSSIQSRYFLDPGIKIRQIEVNSRDGVVTLHGEIASETERNQALTLARTTTGVQRVEDNLTVNPGLDQASAAASAPATVQLDDAAITTALKSKLTQANVGAVTATARGGVVVLEGTVPDSGTKSHVVDIARQSDGVVQVVDRLEVIHANKK